MKALLLVDLQNDFLPGGALAVREGDLVVPVANALMPKFELVAATQDWHPAEHGSFAANHAGRKVGEMIELDGLPQVLWPVHCVAGAHGSAFSPALQADRISHVTRKGTDPRVDSYSGFFDNGHRRQTDLDGYLRSKGVTELYVMGLATDYCVKLTALDARQLGYGVKLVLDGCRAVELKAGDAARAVEQMRAAGVDVIENAEVPMRTARS